VEWALIIRKLEEGRSVIEVDGGLRIAGLPHMIREKDTGKEVFGLLKEMAQLDFQKRIILSRLTPHYLRRG
jgi:hypothetical protein